MPTKAKTPQARRECSRCTMITKGTDTICKTCADKYLRDGKGKTFEETFDLSSAHTAGPWRIVTQEVPFFSFKIIAGKGKSIMGGNRSKAEQEANARLIAAAPELLEALQQILPVIAVESEKKKGFVYRDWIKQATAAIAKAK